MDSYLAGLSTEKINEETRNIDTCSTEEMVAMINRQDALVAGAADSEGLSLAALLLAQRLELTGMVVPGTLDGSPHFWNVVRTESGYRHLDLTRGADSRGQYPLLSDREMAALGYQWDTQAVPPCGEPSDSQEGTEEVPGTSSASSDGAE